MTLLHSILVMSNFSSAHQFIPISETKEWDDLNVTGQPPTKRRAHSCTVIGESQLIVFGGYNGDYCLNDVYTFDTGISTNSIKKIPCPPSPRQRPIPPATEPGRPVPNEFY